MSDSDLITKNASQNKLMYLLKTRGELSAAEMAEPMMMTSMGVRQHLEQLEQDSRVTHHFRSIGKGRPKKLWTLTEKGQSLFPDGHSGLLVNLIDQMQQTLGPQALEKLIIAREKEMLISYQQQLSGLKSVRAKLKKLAQIRSNEGYMAEIIEQDGEIYLAENHCPICAAANQCQQFCRSELHLFRTLLECDIERVEYILSGARRCTYRVNV